MREVTTARRKNTKEFIRRNQKFLNIIQNLSMIINKNKNKFDIMYQPIFR